MKRSVHTSQLKALTLNAGEPVWLSGVVYTARDAAHKKLVEMLEKGEKLPIELEGAVLYYAGPAEAPPGRPIGSCGPTTSGRMDQFAPTLYRRGVAATIGKGSRDAEVVRAIRETGGLYLAAVGGAGALLSACVTRAEVTAFPELGCEAVRRLEIEEMPLFVAIDRRGGNIFEGR